MVAGTLEDGEEGGPTSEVMEDREAEREATEVEETTREATEAPPILRKRFYSKHTLEVCSF